MKANEFVKKFGWDAAKHKADELKIIESMGDKLSFENEILKRLVESHSVVSQYQSLDAAKERLQYFINWLAEHWTHAEFAPEIAKFKQAIFDVESCL